MNLTKIRRYANNPSSLEYLGGGDFGAAYRLPCGRVLKVSDTFDGTAVWLMHAAKALRATGKPPMYAPEVHAFEAQESGRWWAVMEYVTPACKDLSVDLYDSGAPRPMRDYLVLWGDSVGIERHDDYCYPDCHEGNWGTTHSGRLVCFDPFAGEQQNDSPITLGPVPPKVRHRIVQGRGPSLSRWARG